MLQTVNAFKLPIIDKYSYRLSKSLWQYTHDGWRDFDPGSSDLIEVAYKEWQADSSGESITKFTYNGSHYAVNFKEMKQTNTASQTEREVRRISEGTIWH